MKRISVFLLVFLLICVFVACDAKVDNESGSGEQSVTSEQISDSIVNTESDEHRDISEEYLSQDEESNEYSEESFHDPEISDEMSEQSREESGSENSQEPPEESEPEESEVVLTTATPSITQVRTVSDGRVVVSGTCEEGAAILIGKGESIIDTTGSHAGSFVFEVYIKGLNEVINIYAKHKDKHISLPLQQVVRYKTDDPGISDWVWVGKDMWHFFTASSNNYYKSDVLTKGEEIIFKNKISERVNWLSDNLDAQPIYVLVPNPNEIYGEFMPEFAKARPEGITFHEQAVGLLRQAGAVVIDLYPILSEHKYDYHYIYHKTDSHWTEYAAYLAYKELFDHISVKFPESKPRQIEDFGFENQKRQVGDLYADLGMNTTILFEESTFSNLKFSTPVDIYKYQNRDSILINNALTEQLTFTATPKAGRPDVVILRDSYSLMMADFIAERCNTTTLRKMWDFAFNKSLFKELDVDYVIYIICDMNLRNLS